jgi:hypothetical protein
VSRELDRMSWGDDPNFDEDEDCGYELSDPKHPTFYDRMCEKADLERKQRKEDALSGATKLGQMLSEGMKNSERKS